MMAVHGLHLIEAEALADDAQGRVVGRGLGGAVAAEAAEVHRLKGAVDPLVEGVWRGGGKFSGYDPEFLLSLLGLALLKHARWFSSPNR